MYKAKLGQLVIATAGRDESKKFIITCIIDDQYVYISNGDSRKIENPKRKKLKHLKLTGHVSDQISQKLHKKQIVTNNDICKYIKSLDSYREQEV